ncbi:MAG: hypothetical protein E7527_03675 [Ruminococcaceae bacterium]|nr:hypothetical protein [Oscillospiraceae bacterium]
MKRMMVSLMAVVLVLTMSVSVFAAGGFISSPSGRKGPELIDAAIVGCDGELILISYDERDQLSDDKREVFEESYQQIADNKDLSKVCEELKDLAEKLGIDVKDLAVSDLFYLDYTGCDDHEGHGPFTVKIRPEYVNNFVGLMAFVNGEWVLVDGAKVVNGVLTFTGDHYGPYAIVLNTGLSPETGDSFPWIYVVLMGVSAVGLTAVLVALKKKTA